MKRAIKIPGQRSIVFLIIILPKQGNLVNFLLQYIAILNYANFPGLINVQVKKWNKNMTKVRVTVILLTISLIISRSLLHLLIYQIIGRV